MEWLFLAGLALGIPLMTPPLMQALEGRGTDDRPRAGDAGTFAGIGLTTFGLAGLLALGFSTEPTVAVVGAGALGVACGALHPDLLGWLRRRNRLRSLARNGDRTDRDERRA